MNGPKLFKVACIVIFTALGVSMLMRRRSFVPSRPHREPQFDASLPSYAMNGVNGVHTK
jgi:hypothetical protein